MPISLDRRSLPPPERLGRPDGRPGRSGSPHGAREPPERPAGPGALLQRPVPTAPPGPRLQGPKTGRARAGDQGSEGKTRLGWAPRPRERAVETANLADSSRMARDRRDNAQAAGAACLGVWVASTVPAEPTGWPRVVDQLRTPDQFASEAGSTASAPPSPRWRL